MGKIHAKPKASSLSKSEQMILLSANSNNVVKVIKIGYKVRCLYDVRYCNYVLFKILDV